jgi:xanthine dehydrogenase accessory factor
MESLFDALLKAHREGRNCALGVITHIKGSSPQKQGAKALFFDDGTIIGTMGGGCLEAEIQQRARQSLVTGRAAHFDLLLDHDFGWDDGLICGGKVDGLIIPGAQKYSSVWESAASRSNKMNWIIALDYRIELKGSAPGEALYVETISPRHQLWIAGSGHIAQAVAPLAVNLDFEVTVFDDRPALANRQFFPVPTQLQVGPWESLLQLPFPNDRLVYGLIVTRGHQRDALALKSWIQLPFEFLGMIGSRRKKRLLFTQFIEEKIATVESLEKVKCPVGLNLGSRTVYEIAISIAAQLVEWRAAKVMAVSDFLPSDA